MIPTTTRESVLDALRRFDEELHHMQGWKDWANDENHKHESCYTWPPPTGATEMDPDQKDCACLQQIHCSEANELRYAEETVCDDEGTVGGEEEEGIDLSRTRDMTT